MKFIRKVSVLLPPRVHRMLSHNIPTWRPMPLEITRGGWHLFTSRSANRNREHGASVPDSLQSQRAALTFPALGLIVCSKWMESVTC